MHTVGEVHKNEQTADSRHRSISTHISAQHLCKNKIKIDMNILAGAAQLHCEAFNLVIKRNKLLHPL